MFYIIVDTSRLAHLQMNDMPDVLCCTIDLYLDVLNLFVYLVVCPRVCLSVGLFVCPSVCMFA